MIILCCPARLWGGTRDSLAEFAKTAKIIPIDPENISQPWETYASYWGKDNLAIIEQDIIIHESVISQFEECPEPWCLFPFRHHSLDGGFMTTGIGCNRFRREFTEKVSVADIEAVPASCLRCSDRNSKPKQGRKSQCWAHLDGKTREAGEAAGFSIHLHSPAVGHRDYPPGDIYPQ